MTQTLTPSTSDDAVDRLERFQSLSPGHYWRALNEISKPRIEAGEVLLLVDVRYVNDDPHTVILLEHPSKSYNGNQSKIHLLVPDFIAAFEYEPNGEAIRAREIEAIQQHAQDLQSNLLALQSNPQVLRALVDERVKPPVVDSEPATEAPASKGGLPGAHLMDRGQLRTDVGFAIERGLTQADVSAMRAVAEHEAERAKTTATILTERTQEIAMVLGKMAPFFQEKSAVALARTSQVREYAEEIMKGIESMDLYTGKGVEVQTLVEGNPAPAGEPLTLMQRKLFLEEELAVWVDVDEEFDHRHLNRFSQLIAESPSLRDQLLPTPRCVVSVAVRRTDRTYDNAYESLRRNEINRRVFLLVRNGDNVHRVHSVQPSHEAAERLFPTHDEFDQVFTGIDGESITYNDIRFSSKHDKAESLSLHYKRFLILLCGLDHRLKLFGDFYPEQEALSFISTDFQQRHFQFLADDDRSRLLGETPSLRQFLTEKNATLQSGSRVVCFYDDLVDPDSTPAAYSYSFAASDHNEIAKVADPEVFKIVRRQGKDLFVDVAMRRTSWDDDVDGSPLNAKVKIAGVDLKKIHSGVLCLDTVKPEELREFIHNRDCRINHIGYLRLFRRALAHLEGEGRAQQPTVDRLVDDVLAGGLTTDRIEARSWVDEAVTAWRAAKRGALLPGPGNHTALKAILDQIYQQRHGSERLEHRVDALIRERNVTPLKLVVTGSNQHVLYIETPAAERCDGLAWPWVTRLSLKSQKSKLSVQRESLAWLEDRERVDETVIKTWPGLERWLQPYPAPMQPKQWLDAHARLTTVGDELGTIVGPEGWDAQWFESKLSTFYRLSMSGSQSVVFTNMRIPVGLAFGEGRISHLALSVPADQLLYQLGNAEQKARLDEKLIRIYRKPEGRLSMVREQLDFYFEAVKQQPVNPIELIKSGDGRASDPKGLEEARRYTDPKDNRRNFLARTIERPMPEAIAYWLKHPEKDEQILLTRDVWDGHCFRLPAALRAAMEANGTPPKPKDKEESIDEPTL